MKYFIWKYHTSILKISVVSVQSTGISLASHDEVLFSTYEEDSLHNINLSPSPVMTILLLFWMLNFRSGLVFRTVYLLCFKMLSLFF